MIQFTQIITMVKGREKMDINERTYVEQRVANDKKSTTTAYLLWLFLGGLGAHRFYLGKPFSAIILLLCTLFISWWTLFLPTGLFLLIDLFLIPGMVRQHTEKLRRDYTVDMLSNK